MQYADVLAQQWDVVIVGGGPGGLGCALYAARADLKTLVIEKSFLGGLIALTHDVENYPAIDFASGMELTQRMEAQVKKFGTEILYKEVTRLDQAEGGFSVTLGDGQMLHTKTVVIACGSAPRRLPAPGEAEFYGRGVSYCATCDGNFFRDKEIVVVGGGESAFQEGAYLTQFGSKVTLVHRRDEFRATQLAIRRARSKPNWHERLGYTVEQIYGEGTVTGVRLKDVETGEVQDFPTNGVFVFIGYQPASHFADHLVATDPEGYVIVDEKMRTSHAGIWCAGDIIRGSLKQMVISAGNGSTAAIDIREWLAHHEAADEAPVEAELLPAAAGH
jgi:thioredoxin reductase (NADPH)